MGQGGVPLLNAFHERQDCPILAGPGDNEAGDFSGGMSGGPGDASCMHRAGPGDADGERGRGVLRPADRTVAAAKPCLSSRFVSLVV